MAKETKVEAGNDKLKALDQVIAQIEKQHGKGAIMKLGEESNVDIEVIPTGCLTLDNALGIGGVPRGRIVEVYGPESSGTNNCCPSYYCRSTKNGWNCSIY